MRWAWLLVVGASFAGALAIGSQLLGTDASARISDWIYGFIPLGSGLLLVAAGWWSEHRGRAAWMMIGAGVAAWGVGESVWEWYALVVRAEPPYPGIADLFYVAGYPLLFTGVLMVPRARVRRWQGIRLTLDTVVGAVAITGMMWVFYLVRAVVVDPEVSWLEQGFALAYPAGDLFLLVGVLILAGRKTGRHIDGRFVTLGLAMAVTAIADFVYAGQVELETYVSGGRLDALWLIGYGLFAVTALLVANHESGEGPAEGGGLHQMLVPYTAVLMLLLYAMFTVRSPAPVIQGSVAVAGVLIIVRQGVALRETRSFVERQRDDLISSISHELRTPLTAMAGFAELLKADPDMDPATRMELIGIIADQSTQVGRIAGDLVEVTRGQLEHADLDLEEISAARLVDSCLDLVGERVDRAAVTVDVEVGLCVIGDVSRLRQVLVNYLTNAGRYGGDTIGVIGRRDGAMAVIEVHDDGPGVPDRYVRRIWYEFDRGAHGTDIAVKGSGIGLAIARQLMVAHGGAAAYRRSELLGGSCFSMSLPLQPVGAGRPVGTQSSTGDSRSRN